MINADQNAIVSEVAISPELILKPTVTYRIIDNSVYDSNNRIAVITEKLIIVGNQAIYLNQREYYTFVLLLQGRSIDEPGIKRLVPKTLGITRPQEDYP